MAHSEKKNRIQSLGKLLKAAGILTLLGIVLPSATYVESGVWSLLWFIGLFWGGSIYGEEVLGFITDPQYMPTGIIVTVLLIIALILIAVSAINIKNEKNLRLNSGIGLLGGILALISPIIYYFLLNTIHFWDHYFPFIGIFLSVIAGILEIIGAFLILSYRNKSKG